MSGQIQEKLKKLFIGMGKERVKEEFCIDPVY